MEQGNESRPGIEARFKVKTKRFDNHAMLRDRKCVGAAGLPIPPRDAGEAVGEGTITAPMPGLVKALRVAEGDRVETGQVLAVLEAMKMEHQMRAPFDGVVERVGVSEGAQVSDGALLVRLAEPDDG